MTPLKTNYDKKVINRIKRAEGPMRGVQKMMDEETDCQSGVTPDRTIGLIVAEKI